MKNKRKIEIIKYADEIIRMAFNVKLIKETSNYSN